MTFKTPSSPILYNSEINIVLVSPLTTPSSNATVNPESCQAADQNLAFRTHSSVKALQCTRGFTPSSHERLRASLWACMPVIRGYGTTDRLDCFVDLGH